MEVIRRMARPVSAAFVAGALYTSDVGVADAAEKVFMLLPNTTTTRFVARDAPLFSRR
jgi:D-xylose transport system substrate-binding protein